MKDIEINKMFNTTELNRLQRYAKDKNKEKIREWAEDFERRLSEYYHKRYKEYYLEQFKEMMIDNDVALIYALHFSEDTKFDDEKLRSIMKDVQITRKGFYQDDFKRQDYVEMLEKDGINLWEDKE